MFSKFQFVFSSIQLVSNVFIFIHCVKSPIYFRDLYTIENNKYLVIEISSNICFIFAIKLYHGIRCSSTSCEMIIIG